MLRNLLQYSPYQMLGLLYLEWGTSKGVCRSPAVRQPAQTEAGDSLRKALFTNAPTAPINVALSAVCKHKPLTNPTLNGAGKTSGKQLPALCMCLQHNQSCQRESCQ
jgi:hypothetical protein